MSAVLTLLGLLLLASRSAGIALPCESQRTGPRLKGCAECIDKKCYWCSQATQDTLYDANGNVQRCVATYGGARCLTKTKDRNCAACSSIDGECARCKAGFTLAANGKCVKSSCAATSQNPNCRTCNPDGTCAACKRAGLYVVPDNAQWVNRGYPASKCLSKGQANSLSRQIGLVPAVLPPRCVETDAFFRCAACSAGYALNAARKCVRTRSKCRNKPYGQYCQKCNERNGRCTRCVEGRSPDGAGRCSLNCQGLWSFFCNRCNARGCTALFASKVKDYF